MAIINHNSISGINTISVGSSIVIGDNFVLNANGIENVNGINITGVITASSFVGDGSTLTGIDATALKDTDGNVIVQAEASGINVTGVSTFSGSVDVTGHAELDNVNIAGVSTFAGNIDANGDLDVEGHTELDNVNIAGVLTATSAEFSGNVTVLGDLTYENVTNQDSIGIATARAGLRITGGGLDVVGVSTFAGGGNVSAGDWTFTGANYNVFWDNSADALKFNDGAKAVFGTGDDFTIVHTNADTILTDSGTGDVYLRNDNTVFIQNAAGTETKAEFISNGAVNLYHDNINRLQTTSSGINVTGSVECDGLSVIGGDSVLEDSTLYVRKTTGYANIEVGGPTGAYIDFKSPNSDDFDLRLITYGTGGQMNVNGNNLSLLGHFIPETNNTYDLGTSGNQWRNGYFGGTVTCDGLQCDAQAIFTQTAEYQIVVKDSNNTGTAAETGIAFRDSADTVQSFIGHTSNTSENLEIHQTRNADITFSTNGSSRVKISSTGSLRPTSDNVYNLGESSFRWANVYSADLQLSNEGSTNDVDGTWGNYTIQEGEHDLFLINRRSGKKYAFVLREVD